MASNEDSEYHLLYQSLCPSVRRQDWFRNDPNSSLDNHGTTPLHVACFYGLADEIHDLLQNGANVNALNSKGETPLMLFIDYNRDENVGINFIRWSYDLKPNLGICPPLIFRAARKGFWNIVYLLVWSRSKFQDMFKNETLLCLAVDQGKTDVITYLIQMKIDPNMGTPPPLFRAIQKRNLAIIKLLLSAKAQQLRIKQALEQKLKTHPSSFVQQTLNDCTSGTDINYRDAIGRTCLHIAMMIPIFLIEDVPTRGDSEFISIVDLLLQHGAKLDARDNRGCTPALTLLSNDWHETRIDFLSSRGADFNAVTYGGDNALQILHLDLRQNGLLESVTGAMTMDELLKLGVSPSSMDRFATDSLLYSPRGVYRKYMLACMPYSEVRSRYEVIDTNLDEITASAQIQKREEQTLKRRFKVYFRRPLAQRLLSALIDVPPHMIVKKRWENPSDTLGLVLQIVDRSNSSSQ